MMTDDQLGEYLHPMVTGWLFLDSADERKKNPAVASQTSLSVSEEGSQKTKVITCLRESIENLQRTLRRVRGKLSWDGCISEKENLCRYAPKRVGDQKRECHEGQ